MIPLDDLVKILDVSDNPRLRKRALKLAQEAWLACPRESDRARLMLLAARLAENGGRPGFAEELLRRAWDHAGYSEELRSRADLGLAYYLVRRGRVAEALTHADRVSQDSQDLQFGLAQLHASIEVARGDDVARHAAELRDLVSKYARSQDSKPELPVIAARALHISFYAALQDERWEEARADLRSIERCAFVYCSLAGLGDGRAASLASILSLAQLEFSISRANTHQVRAALSHLGNTRSRVEFAVGRDSPLALSLEFNDALARLWLIRVPPAELADTASQEEVEELTARANELGQGLGTSRPTIYRDALQASSILSGALTGATVEVETRRVARQRESIGAVLTTPGPRLKSARLKASTRLNAMSTAEIISEFGLHEYDSGRTEVQIALLHKRILKLTEHLGVAKADHSSRKGLFELVGKRRRLLNHLEQESVERYRILVRRLGLRR